jgi:hypothetical protein
VQAQVSGHAGHGRPSRRRPDDGGGNALHRADERPTGHAASDEATNSQPGLSKTLSVADIDQSWSAPLLSPYAATVAAPRSSLVSREVPSPVLKVVNPWDTLTMRCRSGTTRPVVLGGEGAVCMGQERHRR